MISIVMSCYNRESFIADAIKSVSSQSYTDWELIIVDDNSKDKSIKTIKNTIKILRIEDKVDIYKHGKNEGCGTTLRDAINFSQGNLIAVLDSDDALANKKALEIMVDAHRNNPDASLCYSNMIYCDSKLRPIRKRRTRQIKSNENCLDDKADIVTHLKVFKRRFYDKTEGISEGLIKGVDKDLIFKMEEVGKLVHIDAFLYYYRQHKKNILRKIERNQKYKEAAYRSRDKVYNDARNRRKS